MTAASDPYSARLRRILENGPASPDDYEAARYLIKQGLADGVPGKPSKSRDHYGKTTQLVWFGITPAGRLWLERQSAGAELDQPKGAPEVERNQDARHLPQNVRTVLVEVIREATKPASNLVKLAWTVAAGAVLLMIGYLVKTHLGIPL